MNRPKWYKDGKVLILNARTCGINKDGFEQFKVDHVTGKRGHIIDNQLLDLVNEVEEGTVNNKSAAYIDFKAMLSSHILVPSYYDSTTTKAILSFIKLNDDEFEPKTLGELVAERRIVVMGGHGSPSQDQRVGDVPYIKVSDLRAGQININPSNRIPRQLAEEYWGDKKSGLMAFDLISPERASKNIGEFCVLMPGQEEIVITKEVIVIRSADTAMDQFFLMWALSLQLVRKQWERIVFMQTNREDVGNRVLEIIIPFPRSKAVAKKYSRPFHKYFSALDSAKQTLREELDSQGHKHHLFFA
jgi:hypothetical protein